MRKRSDLIWVVCLHGLCFTHILSKSRCDWTKAVHVHKCSRCMEVRAWERWREIRLQTVNRSPMMDLQYPYHLTFSGLCIRESVRQITSRWQTGLGAKRQEDRKPLNVALLSSSLFLILIIFSSLVSYTLLFPHSVTLSWSCCLCCSFAR